MILSCASPTPQAIILGLYNEADGNFDIYISRGKRVLNIEKNYFCEKIR